MGGGKLAVPSELIVSPKNTTKQQLLTKRKLFAIMNLSLAGTFAQKIRTQKTNNTNQTHSKRTWFTVKGLANMLLPRWSTR